MDLEDIAKSVHARLVEGPSGTIIAVQKDGAIRLELPGQHLAAFERREHAAVVFVATSAPPAVEEILERIRQGMRKLRVIR